MATSILALSAPSPARSIELETLLMPGKLIEKHADLEPDCSNCHERFGKKSQTRLCLDCHEEIQTDISNAQGYHGGLDTNTSCRQCHSDHLGRQADIVHLNPATFNHDSTDFELKGAHGHTSCSACHSDQKPFRETPSDCYTCHGEQSPHRDDIGKDCAGCHQATKWSRVSFDHGETDFPLRGKHRDASCSSCHINERYTDTTQKCNSCHAADDTHNGGNGTQCADCHVPTGWTKTQFDHDTATDFPLKGKHSTVACRSCHGTSTTDPIAGTGCHACHSDDDAHQGRFGKKCASCHTESSWHRTRFDHEQDTDFALRGRHKDVSCTACHRGDAYADALATDCLSCHRLDDAHQEKLGDQCEQCHNEQGWEKDIVFDHDVSHFPLLGLHATVPCEECHSSSAFRDSSTRCADCHGEQDSHDSMLGDRCNQCHNPNGWSIWEFDHTARTRFALEGAHQSLQCIQCHNRPDPSDLNLSTQCQSCHRQDDIHKGRFGSDCSRCHSTGSFADVQIQ